MKNLYLRIANCAILFFVCVGLSACSTTKKDFAKAEEQNTIASYSTFLQKHPDSDFSSLARERIAGFEKQKREEEEARLRREEEARIAAQQKQQEKDKAIQEAIKTDDIESLLTLGPIWDAIDKIVAKRGKPIPKDESESLHKNLVSQYSGGLFSNALELRAAKIQSLDLTTPRLIFIERFWYFRKRGFIFFSSGSVNGTKYTNMCYTGGQFYSLDNTEKQE